MHIQRTSRQLGYNIYEAMKEKKMSILKLSVEMECDRAALGKRINEPWKLRVGEVAQIADILGVTFQDLMRGVE